MPILIECDQCGKKLRAPDTAAGKALKCPGCQARIQVPAASGPAAKTPPAKAAPPLKKAPPPPVDDDEDMDDTPPPRPAKPVAKAPLKKPAPPPAPEDEEEDEAPPPVKSIKPAPKKPIPPPPAEDESEEDDLNFSAAPLPPRPKGKPAKPMIHDEEEESDEDDEKELPRGKGSKAKSAPKKPAVAGKTPWIFLLLAVLPLGVALWRGYHMLQGTQSPLFQGQLGNLWFIIGAGMTALAMGFAQYPKAGNTAKLAGILFANLVAYGFLAYFLFTAEKSPSLADAATWKEFTYAEGPFKVQLPGIPMRKTMTVPQPQGPILQFHFAVERKPENEVIAVFYNDLPASAVAEGANKNLDDGVAGLVQSMKGKNAQPKSIALEGVPGREIFLEGPNGPVRLRLYLAKQRLFGLLAGGQGPAMDTAAAKFFDSFKITGPIPEPEKDDKKDPEPEKKDPEKKDPETKDPEKKDPEKKEPEKKGPEAKKDEPFKGHKGNHLWMDITKDGALLATAAEDKTVILWEVATGKKLGQLEAGQNIRRLRLAPMGEWLIGAGLESVIVWDLNTKKPLKTWPTSGQEVAALDVASNGELIAIAAGDTLRVWSANKFEEVAALKDRGTLHSVQFDPEGKVLYSGRNGDLIHLLDLETLKPRPGWKGAQGGSQKLVLSPDGKHLINVHGMNDLFDAATGKLRTDVKTVPGSIHHLVFSPDSKKLLAHRDNNDFEIFDVPNMNLAGKLSQGSVRQLLFHPDGRLIILTHGEVLMQELK
jgi:hypothetical protein